MGLDHETMQQRSTHLAADVLDAITYCDTLGDALSGFSYIVGTTARLGQGARAVCLAAAGSADNRRSFPGRIKSRFYSVRKIRVLANDELRFCHSVVTIPTSREFSSLNLSQGRDDPLL